MNTGWWYTYPSEKYEFVSLDYEFPTEWKIKIKFQTTNQNINESLDMHNYWLSWFYGDLQSKHIQM